MYCNITNYLELWEFFGRILGYKCTLWYLHPSAETKAPALHMSWIGNIHNAREQFFFDILTPSPFVGHFILRVSLKSCNMTICQIPPLSLFT